ncbi:MAG: hypothetical protein WCI17_04045 [bacterium]
MTGRAHAVSLSRHGPALVFLWERHPVARSAGALPFRVWQA